MNTIRILHLEDNKIDADYVRSLLESQDLSVDITLIDNKHDFMKQLQNGAYDLILADFKLPSFDGISALLLAAKYAGDTPFIFVSGSMGEDLAVDALKHGATDYVLKHHISRLAPAVDRALRESDERRKRRQAEEMQKRMVTILEGTSDVVAIFTREEFVMFLNAAGRYLLEIPLEADLEHTMIRSFSPPELAPVLEKAREYATIHGSWRGESQLLSRSGKTIPVSQVIHAHRDDDGEIQFFSTIIRDISAQKQVEYDLRTAKERAEESERLKDNFIATMSHEIRTPLNVIMGYSAYIRQMLDDSASNELTECLWSIDRAGKRLMRTVENILNISTLRVGTYRMNKELFDLTEEVNSVFRDLQSLAEEKNLAFTSEILHPKAIISADKYAVRGAILNIVDNAIKFTSSGEVKLRIHSREGLIVFECIDTGVGISDTYKENLFKIFSQEEEGYTRSYEGLGIGLALTKQYVELNNGTLEIDSEKGKGSTVRILFPIAGMSL